MQRVGYDADSQTYTYRHNDGSLWEGEEGNRYGVLHRAGQRPSQPTTISPRAKHEDWRYLAPWFVIVAVVLLLLFRYINSSTQAPLECGEGMENYVVAKGDSCWKIANDRGWSVEGLREANGGLDCEKLVPGDQLCVQVAP